jgi:hypothetical protein
VDARSLEERLGSESADERLDAITQVHRESRTDLIDRVRDRLAAESDPRVLAALVGVVGKFGDYDDVQRLAPFLKHKSARVRSAAVKAVMRRDSASIELVKPTLDDRAPRVRAQAIVALARAPGIDVMKSLAQMANSTTPQVALMAVWTSTKLATPPVVPLLVKLARAQDPDVRAEARGALKKLASTLPEAAIVVKAALARRAKKDADPEVGPVDPGSREIKAIPGPDPELSLSGARAPTGVEEPSLPSSRHAVVRPAERGLSFEGARLSDPDNDMSVIGPRGISNDTIETDPDESVLMPISVRDRPAAPPPDSTAPEAPAPVSPPSRISSRTSSPENPASRLATGRLSRPTGSSDPAKPAPRALPPQAMAGMAGVVMLAVLAVIGLSGEDPPPPPPTRPPEVHVPPSIAAPPPVQPSLKPDEPRISWAPAALPPAGIVHIPEPTLEEVIEHMKFSLRNKGITSATVIRLMAYERVQANYRGEIARAREAADQAHFDQALQILDTALEQLAEDHHVGRIEVLRAAINVAKDGGRFDKVAAYRQLLGAEQGKLTEICVEAARKGGFPQSEVAGVIEKLKTMEKTAEQSTRGGDWLSGAKLFEGPDTPAP